jgi:hypothetical protein
MWYLETQFSAKVMDYPYTEKLGLQATDVQAAVAAFENAAWRRNSDHTKSGTLTNDEPIRHCIHTGSRRKVTEENQEQDESVDETMEQHEEVEQASRKRKHIGDDGEEDQNLDEETASSIRNKSETRQTEYRGYPQPAPAEKSKNFGLFPQLAASPTSFVVPALSSLLQLSRHSSPVTDQGPGARDTAGKEETPKRFERLEKIRYITKESEAAYRRQEAGQEDEIICTGARRKSTQDDQLQGVIADALTLRQPSSELARVKSARMELEAAHGIGVDRGKKRADKAFKKELVVDVQIARRPQTASPPVPHGALDAPSHQPSPRLHIPPQRRRPSASPMLSPLSQSASRYTPTVQHGTRMAGHQHAYTQLSSQPHAFTFTPTNVQHAGPYTPISPRQCAHTMRSRQSPPPPVRTTTTKHHLPQTPMSPQQNAPSSPMPRHPSLHQRAQYPQLYQPGLSHAPRYPPHTPQPHEPPPRILRHHSAHEGTQPSRKSAEVMLRKLELEEAEAKLRASIELERLRAEVVAKKKAVAQTLMMEEKGLR